MKRPAIQAGRGESRAEIEALLRWVKGALHRHLEQHGHRLIQTGGQLSDLFVSLSEAQQSLQGASAPLQGLPPAPEAASIPIGPRLALLRDRFALSPIDVALLVVASAPALDVEIARLFTFAWADFTQKMPSVSFICELAVAADPLAGRSAFRPDAPLIRHRLLRLTDGLKGAEATPLMQQGVLVPQPVIDWLLAEPTAITARLAGVARLETIRVESTDLALSPGVAATLDRVFERGLTPTDAGSALTLVLVGAAGAGRRSAACAALHRHGRGMLVVELESVPDPMIADVLADTAREARLRGAVLFLRADALFDDTERVERLLPILLSSLGVQPVVLSARQSLGMLRAADPFEIRFAPLPTPVQLEVWRRALPDPSIAEPLVERFSMSPGAIFAAVHTARRDAGLAAPLANSPPDIHGLTTAVRRRISHALDTVAEAVTTTLGWDDVVLPDNIMDTLQEIRSQARNRSQVYDVWGFRQKVAYGRGLACLFAGPPGTGKTMMATILAADLGREIYRVDLSRVVSKWVGETEKNLSRVFDEAERAQIVLFFDEADSLFSNRTEVKGSNDRFANMEVNYLLQRMEQFDGMSILTTNFERGLDEAFKRRLKFRVQFPLPDAEQRAELWQRCIPAKMPRDADIRWQQLGRKYKLSGGNIKNAVVRAAFYAAEHGQVLTEALLVQAGEAEMREMGRL